MCVWDFYWVHTDYEVKTYPVSLHNCCLWMTSIGDSSGYPRVEALICKHPCTVNWAIELNAIHNVVKNVHGDDLHVSRQYSITKKTGGNQFTHFEV